MGAVVSNENMMPLPNNTDVVCYFVTKHSWKGKYGRIFSIGTRGVTTYNCNTLDVTNRWLYEDVISIRALPQIHEFIIQVRKAKEKKQDTLRFSSAHRSCIITDAIRHMHKFTDKRLGTEYRYRYDVYKYHWSETKLPVTLEVTPFSLDQLDITTAQILSSYYYKDIEAIQNILDIPDTFVVVSAPFGRMHLFSCTNKEDIFIKMKEQAMVYLSMQINFCKDSITYEEFLARRLGRYSSDEYITSLSEFTVNKVQSVRHKDSQRRILCISEACLIERDPQTYNIITLRPLYSIFAFIRDPVDPQLFTIEYTNGNFRYYTAVQRDSLLATLLDGVRICGNLDVHVKMCFTPRDKRLIPLNATPEEELELIHLKFLSQPPAKRSYFEILDRFNAVVPYSGLIHAVSQEGIFSENKEKLILLALQFIMGHEGDQTEIPFIELEAQFQALRRLVASKVGFSALTMITDFREKLGKKVIVAIKRNNEAITHAAIDMICALMQPMHADYDLHREQLNKSSLLSSHQFLETLLDMWVTHIKQNTGALVVTAMLDMLTFALCVPYSETTEGKHFDALLEMVAERGRSLFHLFQHSSLTVIKGAGLIMRALIEEGTVAVAKRMQELALSEGALMTHLIIALFTRDVDKRMLTHRQLSRHLVGLWVTNNDHAMNLLKRILPSGLLSYLESDEVVPEVENDLLITRDNLKLAQDLSMRNQRNPHLIAIERKWRSIEKEIEAALSHWGASLGLEKHDREKKIKDRPVVLRKRRELFKSAGNWKLFYWKFNQDHLFPTLIWNHKTREELRESLNKEIHAFRTDREIKINDLIAWNYEEFEMHYTSLEDEVCVDGYYLRLLLESSELKVKNPFHFFYDLYHRFLLTAKSEMRCLCLQAMTMLYSQYSENIGSFKDTKYIVSILDRSFDFLERDRTVLFLAKLIELKENAKILIDCNGITILIDLLTLAHLHVSRAVVPMQSNVIEAGQGMLEDNVKEWHYAVGDTTVGPVTFTQLRESFTKGEINARSKCWSQGMDGWRMISQVTQLKWTLLAKGQPLLNESELASHILSILIRICQFYPNRDCDNAVIWPVPRIKKTLSENHCFPHIVQLLLTFDSVLVEKVSLLLCELAVDNLNASKFYLSGVFFFILMYTGSNVLPIARFLQITHGIQAFRYEKEQACELMQRSILGPLLPDAMVYYLENHGSEKFAQIFLGEYDTPEAIWNSEMRRFLIEKIASHIADFTPRLKSNNRALYQYCRIPTIRYEQLGSELFCNIFYLRHLCDTTRFPDWPINDPVKLLRDVLEMWSDEVEKKPPTMSVDDAYEALELPRTIHHDEHIIRKAYYRLAQMYHPDKNPKGQEKFLAVNKAYDFLCSRSWNLQGPNPNNIVLILKTQSILFRRYSTELQPYKYAGYKQLIRTIQLETCDEQLFSKSVNLLIDATELSYHTVNCSALNAEELNREHGFTSLLEANSRCVSVLSKSSKPTDAAVQICSNCTRTFCVAAQFSACRESFTQMSHLITDLVRILHFKHLTKLCCDVVECIILFSKDAYLQQSLVEASVIFHLLLFLFKYDFTLEKCGVEHSEEANTQEVLNKLARLSIKACGALGGYLTGENSTPINNTARVIFTKLLTHFITDQFVKEDWHTLLKTLNSNSETPYLIWNNTTRAELNDFLENRCKRRNETISADVLDQFDLKYTGHTNELVIGNIFIRIYNAQPNYVIENAKEFLTELLEYAKEKLLNKSETIKHLKNIIMALQALHNLIMNNPGLEVNCIGYFEILFSYLSLEGYHDLQHISLNVIAAATRNQECVNNIASIDGLVHLFLSLFSLHSDQIIILDILNALSTSPVVVKDILTRGFYIYLLDLLCNSTNSNVRLKTSELISRLLSDKLSGPRVRLMLGRFLPFAVCETFKDLPNTAIQLLDSNQENPEMVWNDKFRKKVFATIRKLTKKHYEKQCCSPCNIVKLPEDGPVLSEITNEVIVAGVYLRLFNQNPAWNVRRPREFLIELLDACLNSMTRDQYDQLEIYTISLVRLLEAQPNLSDHVPSLGHIPKLCLNLMSTSSSVVPYSAIAILHQLSRSEVCVTTLSQTECLGPIKQAMTHYSNTIGIASETLSRMFFFQKDYLVKQALDVDLIPYLLSLLDGQLEGVENGAMIKAQVVKTLKDMTLSLTYGSFVLNLLDKSSVWSAYRDQNHDLFLSSSHSLQRLTGATVSSGYLTQSTSKPMPSVPPPMSNDY